MNTNIYGDFQICIIVPLIVVFFFTRSDLYVRQSGKCLLETGQKIQWDYECEYRIIYNGLVLFNVYIMDM